MSARLDPSMVRARSTQHRRILNDSPNLISFENITLPCIANSQLNYYQSVFTSLCSQSGELK